MSLVPKEAGSFTNLDPRCFAKQEDLPSSELGDFMANDEELPVAFQNTHAVQNAMTYSQIKRRDLARIEHTDAQKKKSRLDDIGNDNISDGLDVSIFLPYSEEKTKDVIKKDEPLTSFSSTSTNIAQTQQSFQATLHNYVVDEAQSAGSPFEENFWSILLSPQMEVSNSLLQENESNAEESVQHDNQDVPEANSMQQESSSTSRETGGGGSHGHDPMLHPMSYNHSEIQSNEPGPSSYTLSAPTYDKPLSSDKYQTSNFVLELNASEDTEFMRVPCSLLNKCQPIGEPEIKKIHAYCTLDSVQKNVKMVLARMATGSISEAELCDNVRKDRERLEKLEAELQNNGKDVLVAANNVVPNLPEGPDTSISVEGHTISQTVWADAYSKMDLKNSAVCLFEELYSQAEKASSTVSGRFCTLKDGSKIKPPKLDPKRLNVIKHALASMMKKKHTFYYDPKDFVNLKNSEVATIKGALSQRLNQIKQLKKKS